MNRPSVLNISEVPVLTTISAAVTVPKKVVATTPAVSDEVIRLASRLLAITPGESSIISWTAVENMLNPMRLAMDLAYALMQLQQGLVLLIDANFRRPTLHAQFGLTLQPGFAEMLRGSVMLTDALRTTAHPQLTVLPAGTPVSETSPITPAETTRVFEELRRRFGYIVVQSPAYFESVDPALLAARVDGVVIAAQSGKTRKAQLREIKRELEAVKARLFGVALVQEPLRNGR